MPGARIVVEGRVQGVGFRGYTYKVALEGGITGEVWNTRSGTVEMTVWAESGEVLDGFIQRMHDGPGYVTAIRRFSYEGTAPDRFEIGETR